MITSQNREELGRLLGAVAASCLLHLGILMLAHLVHGGIPPLAIPHALAPPAPFAVSLKSANARTTPLPQLPGIEAGKNQPTQSGATGIAPIVNEETGENAHLLQARSITYYPSDQLSIKPQPVFVGELDTAETKSIPASGRMVIKLWIDDRGSVVDAVLERSDLPDVFSLAAVAAFQQAKFVPGERKGISVGTVMRIEIKYEDGRLLDH